MDWVLFIFGVVLFLFLGVIFVYVVVRAAGVAWFRSRMEHIRQLGKDKANDV